MVKQRSFQEMYSEIQLNMEQKNRIWEQVKTHNQDSKIKGKGLHHVPAFTALCICLVLLVGVPVLAANTSVLERIAEAFHTLSGNEEELTNEQKSVFEKYGNALNAQIPLEDGTLTLEAVIHDGYYIFIPFSITLNDKADSKTANSTSLRREAAFNNLTALTFCTPDNPFSLGTFAMASLDSPPIENKDINGCYLMDTDEELRQGDTLLIQKREDATELPVTICEVTMSAPVISQSIPLSAAQFQLENGVTFDEIQLSPISLRLKGTAPNTGVGNSVYASNVTFELKDGSTVAEVHSGYNRKKIDDEKGTYSYEKMIFFASPIKMEEAAGIRINSLDLWIPFTAAKEQ